MNITGTFGELAMYKVRWMDCYGEENTDYVAVPNNHPETAAELVIRSTHEATFMHLSEVPKKVQMHDLYIVLP